MTPANDIRPSGAQRLQWQQLQNLHSRVIDRGDGVARRLRHSEFSLFFKSENPCHGRFVCHNTNSVAVCLRHRRAVIDFVESEPLRARLMRAETTYT